MKSHTSLGMWLFIHAVIVIIPCNKRGPELYILSYKINFMLWFALFCYGCGGSFGGFMRLLCSCIVAWRRQAFTWTNVDLSSVKFSDINLRAISQAKDLFSIKLT